MSEQTKAGKIEKFILLSSEDDNALFNISFSDVFTLKEILGITKSNESQLKYVQLDLLALTIPLQTDDPKKNDDYMCLDSSLIETAVNHEQTKTYIIDGAKKKRFKFVQLGIF